MKRYCVMASFALTVLVGVPQAVAQKATPQGPPCSVDRVAGDWGAVTSYKMADTDVNAIATVRINKDGTSSAHLFANVGGSYVEFDRYGITTVNEDNCTTLQTWNDGGPDAHCVIVDDGNEMWCMYEGPNLSLVTLKRIHTRN